jgi:hypothetical protein
MESGRERFAAPGGHGSGNCQPPVASPRSARAKRSICGLENNLTGYYRNGVFLKTTPSEP